MANISSEEEHIKTEARAINGAISNLRGLIRGLEKDGARFTGEVDTISKSIDKIVSELNDAVGKVAKDN